MSVQAIAQHGSHPRFIVRLCPFVVELLDHFDGFFTLSIFFFPIKVWSECLCSFSDLEMANRLKEGSPVSLSLGGKRSSYASLDDGANDGANAVRTRHQFFCVFGKFFH